MNWFKSEFPVTDRVAPRILESIAELSYIRRDMLAVFMTQELYDAMAKEHQMLTYDGNMPNVLFGLPIRIVEAPGVRACWVGVLAYKEDEHEESA